MKRVSKAAAALGALVLVVGSAACSANVVEGSITGATATPSAQTQLMKTASSTTAGASVGDVVRASQPAVVRIQTSDGVGSGFFVSADGYVVTNNHVVQTTTGRSTTLASTVQVTTDDGGVLTANVVGTDAATDLALLKVSGSGYPFLNFASLANTNVGDQVVAIGYALDLSNGTGAPTVTQGIVSAKDRAISESASTTILGAIQTDAAVNHGNSGGPLLNMQGQVVGINTSLVPDSSTGAAAEGISLAVGSDTAKAVVAQLQSNKAVSRGYLGIHGFEPLTAAKAKALGVPNGVTGIYLPAAQDLAAAGGTNLTRSAASSVATGGPASTAGLQPGDVITSIDGHAIGDDSALSVAMIGHKAGDSVSIEVYRGGTKMTLTPTLSAG